MATMATTTPPQTPLEISQHAEILELESQIRNLNTKISAAVDHAADLQDEIRRMRIRQREEEAVAAAAAQDALANESSGLRRMSTYFSRRTATPPPPSSSSTTMPVSFPRSLSMSPTKPSSSPRKDHEEGGGGGGDDLFAQLAKERRLRKDFEVRYRALQQESEELSQSLFEEANKMVSVEKRLTHAAESKLTVFQEREVQRRQRVDELEAALGTIHRVRAVLATPLTLSMT